MAEVRLPNLRIGFPYGATVQFPTGFLAAGESCRAKLRKYPGQEPAPATFATARVGDDIELDLTALQTAALEPGTYLTELIIYVPDTPSIPEIPVADNTFRIEVDHSPSA